MRRGAPINGRIDLPWVHSRMVFDEDGVTVKRKKAASQKPAALAIEMQRRGNQGKKDWMAGTVAGQSADLSNHEYLTHGQEGACLIACLEGRCILPPSLKHSSKPTAKW